MWHRAVVVSSLVVSIGFLGVLMTPPRTHAVNVSATVCGEAVSPTLTINRPASDSTYPSGQVTLTGTVNYTNQLEVQVDGSYDSTISIVSGEEPNPYSVDLQLSEGQHRIDIIAAGMCGADNTTETVFITVDLESGPDNVVPPATTSVSTSGGGIIIGPENITSQQPDVPSTDSTTSSPEDGVGISQPLTTKAAIRSYAFFVGMLALGAGIVAASSLPLLGVIQWARWWLIGVGAIIMLLSLLLDL